MSTIYAMSSCGAFVAWSMATPGHSFGEWSLISITGEVIRFVRTLSREEISTFQSAGHLWWGVQLRNQPWAIVAYQPAHADQCRSTAAYIGSSDDPLLQTGV